MTGLRFGEMCRRRAQSFRRGASPTSRLPRPHRMRFKYRPGQRIRSVEASLRAVAWLAVLVVISAAATMSLHNPRAAGREYYVAVYGLPTNDGGFTKPLDLTTALSRESPARPGDTIWIRGG